MRLPDYYDQIPSLRLFDPLAAMLGAARDGLLEYHYADAVKLAGHSCPTVAGAWLLTRRALARLYPDSLPLRGGMRVELRDAQAAGTTGVVGNVMGLITGAAGEGGFKGLGGRLGRANLLNYGVQLPAEVRFTRLDTGASASLSYHPERVPPDPSLPGLMQRLLAGDADDAARQTFAHLWQERVRRILLEHADDPAVVESLD
ncbi:MAG TPA: hypothetical protein PLW81_09195 [Thiobacillaceae bacterium]|nr:hypothetical protein [Thiobacillaceae bacterium]